MNETPERASTKSARRRRPRAAGGRGQGGPAAAKPRPARRPRSSPLAVITAALGLFLIVLTLLAIQVRKGRDPALGSARRPRCSPSPAPTGAIQARNLPGNQDRQPDLAGAAAVSAAGPSASPRARRQLPTRILAILVLIGLDCTGLLHDVLGADQCAHSVGPQAAPVQACAAGAWRQRSGKSRRRMSPIPATTPSGSRRARRGSLPFS